VARFFLFSACLSAVSFQFALPRGVRPTRLFLFPKRALRLLLLVTNRRGVRFLARCLPIHLSCPPPVFSSLFLDFLVLYVARRPLKRVQAWIQTSFPLLDFRASEMLPSPLFLRSSLLSIYVSSERILEPILQQGDSRVPVAVPPEVISPRHHLAPFLYRFELFM